MQYINRNELNCVIPSPFHIADRYCDIHWRMEPAIWDFHNIMLVVSGEGMDITEGKEYGMLPGTLFYHYPGQYYGFETSKSRLMHCFGINFHLLWTRCNSGVWDHKPVDRLSFGHCINIPRMDVLVRLFTHLAEIWSKSGMNTDLQCRSVFMQILHEISQQMLSSQGNTRVSQKIGWTIDYIQKYYNQPVTLEFLGNYAELNPGYFGEVFKKSMGQTPVEYINEVRIRKAEEYLQAGCSVTETASRVGFADPFYFSRVFRKFRGVSPREFVKSYP